MRLDFLGGEGAGLPASIVEELDGTLRIPMRDGVESLSVGAAAAVLGLRGPEIADGLASYDGVGRRFDVKGEHAGVLIVDDYGHHPTEIQVTLETPPILTMTAGSVAWPSRA